jgi:predicted small secreted protein
MRKWIRLFSVIAAVLLAGLVLTACGSGAAGTGGSASEGKSLQDAYKDFPEVDKLCPVDKLLGEWVEKDDATRFARIAKDGDTYVYEDNEGKYPATFQAGAMDVMVDDTNTAIVYLDVKTGELLCVYNKEGVRFIRK